MASKKIIKRRITSVRATRQIMKAMDMVAASKLQRVKLRLMASRPLFDESRRIIGMLKNCDGVVNNVFIQPREVKNVAYVVITSNRGLCGSYNANISTKALAHMKDKSNEQIIAVGTKGRDYFRRRGRNITNTHTTVTETVLYQDAVAIGEEIMKLYESGAVDEVYVAYTYFVSSMSYEPRVVKILPLADSEEPAEKTEAMNYEPNVETFLNNALPTYLSAFLYGALLESNTCEQASRMISMNSATKNASEIIDKLTLVYNRKRQADITQEINEIVSGASVSK